MDKQTKLIVGVLVIAGILVISGVVWVAYERYKEVSGMLQPPPKSDGWEVYLFKTDLTNNKIIFTNFSYTGDEELIWENMEITNGTAILPTGPIHKADEITNCLGYVCLTWKPSNKTLACSDFT